MDAEFTKYLASLGVGGILAAVFYYQNTKISQDYAGQLKQLLEQERGRTDMLVNLVIKVSEAITKNTAVTESFHVRLDRDNGARL